jgi:hypothetical protein
MGRELKQGQIVRGRLFSEPMRVETVANLGDGTWRVGLVGTQTEKFRSVSLFAADLAELTVLESSPSFEGTATCSASAFRLMPSGSRLSLILTSAFPFPASIHFRINLKPSTTIS